MNVARKIFTANFLIKNNFFTSKVILLLLMLLFPIFYNLGGQIMMRWDEARYADSSYEMLHGKNPFVVTYFFHPELESTKPPLLHWLQSISIALLGFNETSVRLPSAFAGIFTCLALLIFTKRKFNSVSLGAIAALILITTPQGFAGIDHSVRTADYDALLMFFSFAGALNFFLYNENTKKNSYIFLSALFFTLAVLTKGPAGLFYLPGLFIFTLVKKNLLALFKNKWFYFSLAFFVIIVGFVFLIREYFSPGYLRAFNEMEFMGRHNNVQDEHTGNWWFYIDNFVNDRFGNWFIFIPLGWISAFFCKERSVRSYSLFSFILTGCYFIIISSARSKLSWYELQLFPLLALQAGIFIWIVGKYAAEFLAAKTRMSRPLIFYLFLGIIFASPYKDTVTNLVYNEYNDGFRSYNAIQCYLQPEPAVAKNCKILITNESYRAHYLFYFYKLNEKGFNLKMDYAISACSEGDKIICDDEKWQREIEKKYNVALLDKFLQLKVYRILSAKI